MCCWQEPYLITAVCHQVCATLAGVSVISDTLFLLVVLSRLHHKHSPHSRTSAFVHPVHHPGSTEVWENTRHGCWCQQGSFGWAVYIHDATVNVAAAAARSQTCIAWYSRTICQMKIASDAQHKHGHVLLICSSTAAAATAAVAVAAAGIVVPSLTFPNHPDVETAALYICHQMCLPAVCTRWPV